MKCAVCKSKKIEKGFYKSDKFEISTLGKNENVQSVVSKCKDCGFVFLYPRKTESWYNRFYKNQHRIIGSFDNKEHLIKRKDEFKFIKKYVKGLRIFDIGAFDGGLLNLFKTNGYTVNGNEPSLQAVEYAKNNYNIELINSTEFPNDKYDIVTCSNVLEHIYNINEFIINIKKIITDNGYLYIEVPNLNYIHKWNNISEYFIFQHLNYFTINTLYLLLLRHGFTMVANEEAGPWIRCIVKKYINSKMQIYFKNNINLKNELSNIKGDIIIFGGGQHTGQILPYLKNCNISVIFDSNPDMDKRKINGIDITHISNINNYQFDKILISSYDFQEDMYKTLKEYGIDDSKIIKLYDWFYFN